jgi:hypothetical protein
LLFDPTTGARDDRFFAEFLMDALLRGDLQARAQFYRFAILDGWMTRNEVRVKENLNPDTAQLDEFLEPQNMRNVTTGDTVVGPPAGRPSHAPDDSGDGGPNARRSVRTTMLAIEAAQRVVRKELAAVEKAATRYASDGAAWAQWLHTFYADHAGFVAETLKLPLPLAREYAARQGTQLEAQGIAAAADWEWTVASELATWAIDGGRAELTRLLPEPAAPIVVQAVADSTPAKPKTKRIRVTERDADGRLVAAEVIEEEIADGE